MKLSQKLKNIFCFHGRVQSWIETKEFDVQCNLWGCWKVKVYECPKCHKKIKMEEWDYLKMASDEFLTELTLKVSKANADIGDYKTAIKVLKLTN